MNIQTYQMISKRTQASDLTEREEKLTAALGLTDEFLELTEALTENHSEEELVEECGDVCFYAAWIASAYGVEVSSFPESTVGRHDSNDHDLLTITKLAGTLAGTVKKNISQGHDLGTKKVLSKKWIGIVCGELMLAVCEVCGVHWYDVANKNVEKLKERYPTKFTQEDSINRKEYV